MIFDPAVKLTTDQLEILMLVEQLQSVGMWCAAFNQLEDREVLDLLVAATPNTPN